MPPPPAEGFASRLVLGPALRAQPDRRLVTLVREGYEAAFEEIVRRYAKPLSRYAGAIVGGRAEDVTQDAFSKALQALRRDDAEIDLRPWLYRIVRNTALNELRDRPPEAEALAESITGGQSPAERAEQRERLAGLIEGLRSLPEPQRAAIVMRELEGLSHEEIAAALGLSGGGARQAIYRARQALRDGAALLLPLPLIRFLIDHGGDAATAGAAGSAGGAAVAATGASGAGAGGVALKAGVAAVVLAGSVGTGVALRDEGGGRTADASPPPARVSSTGAGGPAAATVAVEPVDGSSGSGSGSGGDRDGYGHSDDNRGSDEREHEAQHERHGARSRGGGRSRGRAGFEGRPPHERERHGDGGHGGPRPQRHGDRSGPGGDGGDRDPDGDRLRSSDGPGPDGGEAESRSGPRNGGSEPPPEEEDRSGSGDGGSSGSDSGESGESGGDPDSSRPRDLEP